MNHWSQKVKSFKVNEAMDGSDLVLEIVVSMNNRGINFSDKVLPRVETRGWRKY